MPCSPCRASTPHLCSTSPLGLRHQLPSAYPFPFGASPTCCPPLSSPLMHSHCSHRQVYRPSSRFWDVPTLSFIRPSISCLLPTNLWTSLASLLRSPKFGFAFSLAFSEVVLDSNPILILECTEQLVVPLKTSYKSRYISV